MITSFIKNLIKKQESVYADWYKEYLKQNSTYDSNKKIYEQKYLILDTETTGLNPRTDIVLSIGAVEVENKWIKTSESLALLIADGSVSSSEAIKIHGLIKTKERGLAGVEAIQSLMRQLHNHVIVGHHIRFDIMMLEKLSIAAGGGPIRNKLIDTAVLAKRIDNPHQDVIHRDETYKLDELCRKYKIATKARHTSEGDAYITAILFLKLLRIMHNKGISKVKEIVLK